MTRQRSHNTTMLLPSLVALLLLLLALDEVTADRVFAGSENYRIALAVKSTASPFFAVSHNGCVDAARRLGVTCMYVGPSEGVDAVEQARIITELVDNKEVDGLAISVIDAPTITPVIAHAVANGIPVVTFDSDAPDSLRRSYIGTNNTFLGQQLAKVLKQLVPDVTEATYAVVSAPNPNIQEREAGFKGALDPDQWTEISISPSDMEGNDTLAIVQIQEFGRLKPTAIVPMMGAPMRAEGWRPFVNAHPSITMVVADGMPNQLELLSENYADGLVAQKPYEMGSMAVEVLYDLLQGKKLVPDFIGTNLLEHTNIPLVLPELVVDQNLIGDLRFVGFILFGLVFFIAASFCAWMWMHRSVRVVMVSQPKFVYIIALGVVLMAAAMVPLGFDDSTADDGGTAICMSTPWLGILGFALTFTGLFAKTARVKMIFQAQAVGSRPSEAQVLRPFLVLLLANVVVLTVWSIVDPLTYVRIDHEGTDGWNRIVSTYATCQSENVVPYMVPLAILNLGVLIIGNWHAYQTRMIKSEFSESKFIGLSMASMLQAMLTGIPLLFLVRDNPQAYYLILVFMIFVISMVILVLMFVPKIVYAIGTKDMDLSEQNQLIQKQIQDSIEAVQFSSSRGFSSRNLTSELNNTIIHEQEDEEDHDEGDEQSNQSLDEPEPTVEDPIIDADCSFARRSQVAGYNGETDKARLSPMEGNRAKVSQPTLLKDTAFPGLESEQTLATEDQSDSAESSPGAVTMVPTTGQNSFLKKRIGVATGNTAGYDSTPGAFSVQPSGSIDTRSTEEHAVVDEATNTSQRTMFGPDNHEKDLVLKERYRAAMLATAPDVITPEGLDHALDSSSSNHSSES